MKRFLASIAVSATALSAIPASAQTTGVTYQGRLTQSGQAYNGNVAAIFRVFDAPTGGTLIGSQTVNALTVTDGLFNTILNDAQQLGSNAFDGSPRWIEIQIGGETLSPRQPLTATPYALKVRGVDGHSLDSEGGAIEDVVRVSPDGTFEVGANVVFGTPVVDLDINSPNGGGFGLTSLSQTFSPTYSGRLAGITLRISNENSASPATVSVSLAQGATVLSSTDRNNILGPYTDYFFDLPDVEIEAGTVYTFTYSHNHSLMSIYAVPGDTYPGFTSFNGFDLRFQTHMVPIVDIRGVLNASNNAVSIGADSFGSLLQVGGGFDASSSTTLGVAQQPEHTVALSLRNLLDNAVLQFCSPTLCNYIEMVEDTGTLMLGSNGNGDGQTALSIGTNGNVVIGSEEPGPSKLDVRGMARFGVGTSVFVGQDGGNNASIELGQRPGDTPYIDFRNDPFSDFDARLLLESDDRLVLYSATLNVPTIEIRGGSDLAEPYHIAASSAGTLPQPGMVVAIDAKQLGGMRVADAAYDTTVAGIISGANGVNPGLTLTQEGTVADGSMPIAKAGRVWCLVDADANGPIKPGDMLTSSTTPGHAMRASDRERAFGSVIGKAMSELPSGKGYVLVLVSLQ